MDNILDVQNDTTKRYWKAQNFRPNYEKILVEIGKSRDV